MPRPVVLAVDDDPGVLRAVEKDLRRHYGADYRIVRAESGAAALEVLAELVRRGDAAALLVVDQRMPKMSGVELLERAADLYPETKRVLLTAYADTDAAISAINDAQVDHYLLKPWDPPEQQLYPVLDDLLEQWQATFRPPFEGVRVVGNQWAAESHRVKDFLARNQIPYRWLDIESSDEARLLAETAGLTASDLPCLLFPDGAGLSCPENREIAEKVGLQTVADRPFYDVVVVGAGPAGLASAVYSASEGLRTLVVEHEAPGGQAGTSSRIENYLGFPAGVAGSELARRAVTQARRFGVEILATQEVVGLRSAGPARVLELADGTEIQARVLVIATGMSYRQIDVPGIAELNGAGVYYGSAMTEGERVRDAPVYVVGGANSAGQAAMYFARFTDDVTMLVRGEGLSNTMSRYLLDQIEASTAVIVRTSTQVVEATGESQLEALRLRDAGGNVEVVPAAALFIFIGAVPRSSWLPPSVERDDHGFVLTGTDVTAFGTSMPEAIDRAPHMLESSLPGVFVAGDVRRGSVKRVASAVGEGSMALMQARHYLSQV